MKTTKIKTIKKVPKVFYSDEVGNDTDCSREANKICAYAIGSVIMYQINHDTGYNGVFIHVHYNWKENSLLVRTWGEIHIIIN